MVSSFDESVSEIWDGLGLMGGLDLGRLGVPHGEISLSDRITRFVPCGASAD